MSRAAPIAAALALLAGGAAADPLPPDVVQTGPLAPPPLPKIPGVINARTGQTISRPAAAKPGAATEMYQFLLAGGSDLQVTLAGAGPLALRLYTSGGEEILSAIGDAILRLDAIAPLDDLYFLSVSRVDGTKSYRLNLVEKPVDSLTAISRWGVGYETLGDKGQPVSASCWLQPGVKLRRNYPAGQVAVITLMADGRARSESSAPGKPDRVVEWTTTLDGETAIQTFATGRTNRFDAFAANFGAYRGYLCK